MLWEAKGHSWSWKRCRWILTSHFGCFLKRTVQSLCDWCMCIYTYIYRHTCSSLVWHTQGWICLSVSKCVKELHPASSPKSMWLVNVQHHGDFIAGHTSQSTAFPEYHFTSEVIHFPLRRMNSKEKENIVTSKHLIGIRNQRAGRVVLVGLADVKSWMH